MNGLGYSQLSNPNRSLKLVLMRVEIIENSFPILLGNYLEIIDISTTLAKDFIASHSLSQSPPILSVDDPILIIHSYSWTLCHIQYMTF